MVANRRQFLRSVFKMAGITGLVRLGLSPFELKQAIAGFNLDWFDEAATGCSGYKGVALSVGASNGTTSSAYGTKYTHSGGGCDVNYMELYTRSTTAATFIKLAIYDDNTGPNNLLRTVSEFAPASDNWVGGALSSALSLVDSAVYWFIFKGNGAVDYKYDTGSSGDTDYNTAISYASFPADPWSSSGTSDRLISMRVSYA